MNSKASTLNHSASRPRFFFAVIVVLLSGYVLVSSGYSQADSENWLLGTQWTLEREDGYRCKIFVTDKIKHSNDGRFFDYTLATPYSIEYQGLKRKISLSFNEGGKKGKYHDEAGASGTLTRIGSVPKPVKSEKEKSEIPMVERPDVSEKSWTNNDGTTIEAAFVCQYGGQVVIQTTDGTKHTIPLTNLDAASREKARRLAVSAFVPWTAADIKEVWKNSLPPLPATLAPDYHQIKKSNAKRRQQIDAGVFDDLAISQALRTNIDELVALQQPDLALVYQKSLTAHQQSVAAKQQARAAVAQDAQIGAFSADLEDLRSRINTAMSMHYMSVFKD